MHIHASALFGLTVFVFVLLYGTAWRLLAGIVGKNNPAAGGAMAAQF